MKINYRILSLLLLISIFYSCQSDIDRASEVISVEGFGKYVKELGSDAYMGRKPFTEGEEKTLGYLEQEFRKLGLEPGNNGSFYQDVPMVQVTVDPSNTMDFSVRGSKFSLNYRDDWVAFSQRIVEKIILDGVEMVFAGYGIVAPEYDWNDYAGFDPAGKLVVVLVNDPGFGTENKAFFNGNAMTYYGRWTYKYEEAARQGATGLLIIHQDAQAGYPWSVVHNGAVVPKLYLEPDNDYKNRCAVEGWLTEQAADKLFDAAGLDLDKSKQNAKKTGFRAEPLNITASLDITSVFKYNESKNIMGLIRGSKRPEEVIIYSAHWDHLGIGAPVDGDSIYNGAVDNGTSLAWMMEIAKAFRELKEAPLRTVMFLAPTAEEQGLLGAKFYVENPVFPLSKTVADINNDLMLPMGRMKDVMVTGYGQNELEDYVARAAEKQDRYIFPDPNPETGMFYRADHFAFARAGVPALFVRGNCDHREKGREYAAKTENDYLMNYYHKPADEYDPETWDFSGLVEDAQLLFRVGYEIANDTVFPGWKEGSEFKAIREGYMKKSSNK